MIDHDDHVIATVPRSVMRRDNLLHRSVGIVVRNPAGEVLIHRRAETKDVWPGRWDLAVGGVVSSGEDPFAAARRELAEEVGVTGGDPVFLGIGVFEDAAVRCRCSCFEIVHDGPVEFHDGEVIEARWVEVAELRSLLAAASFVPDSIALFGMFRPEFCAG